jgi:hypothetical protein
MAFETAQASSIQDLMDKLSTFATANGWTEDHAAAGRLFLSKSTVFVSFRWSTTSPTVVGIYHALGFISSGTDPGNHTDDSGQGIVSGTDGTIATGRCVPIPNSTVTYWFFEDDTYIHVVVQASAGDFRHFGFGIVDKEGTWTGGEYAYGWRFSSAGGTSELAVRGDSTMLLDGIAGAATGVPGAGAIATVRPFVSTLHCESLPNQAGSSKWALVWGGGTSTNNDRAGNARVFVNGGFRGGALPAIFARFRGTNLTGLIPMYPFHLWYDDPSNARFYLIGTQPDVRGISMAAFEGGDEIVVGADTWVVFPARAKTAVSSTLNTRNQGIAYRKLV